MILPCTCQHAFQSRRYGGVNRVHNEFVDNSGHLQYRCTICNSERGVGKAEPQRKKGKK